MGDVFQALAGTASTLPPSSHKDIAGSAVDIPAATPSDSVSPIVSNQKTPPAVAAKPKQPSPKQPSQHVITSKSSSMGFMLSEVLRGF